MRPIWQFLTDFGDTAVTVPFAVLVAAFLFIVREMRLAIGWALVVAGVAAVMAALKLASVICGFPLAGSGLSSPSGHTAMSIAVYGGFAAVAGGSLGRKARAAVIAIAAMLAIGIAVSRSIGGYHTPLEVAAGLMVGGAGLAAMIALARQFPPARRLPIGWLALGAVIVFALFHGTRWPAERMLHRLAWWLNILRPLCG